MTTEEFSNEFDILLDSNHFIRDFGEVSNKVDIVLDEYEKSMFLTKAQEELVLEVYTGKNIYSDSFERTEEARRYLNKLVKTIIISAKLSGLIGLSDTSTFFQLPEDVWFITYESAVLKDERLGCLDGEEALVIPVTQDTYYKMADNPFRGPSKSRVLRLDIENNIVEIVSNYNIDRYIVRYLARPKPIILSDLDGLTINDIGVRTECELNSAFHRNILERAVKLAIAAKSKTIKE